MGHAPRLVKYIMPYNTPPVIVYRLPIYRRPILHWLTYLACFWAFLSKYRIGYIVTWHGVNFHQPINPVGY